MTAADLPRLTIAQLQELFRRGEVSPRESIEALYSRTESVDPEIGAYLSLELEAALSVAERADIRLPLGGIPIAIKDVISVSGQLCTCGSKNLQHYRASFDATAIVRLKEAGAIPFGRTNMDEFAMGSSTENSSFKATRNPWDLKRVPGGSSGGSAAAVAADLAIAALGSDTGGSIRQPAAFSGVVGLKPSYGRVSRYGLVSFAPSLDQIGPITKTVRDAALLLQATAGIDAKDSTSVDLPVPNYVAALEGDLRGIRLGVPNEYFREGIDPAVKKVVEVAILQLASLGAEIINVPLPHTSHAIDAYYVIAAAEASASLARFDGVRYGYRAAHSKDLLDHYCRTRAEGFGPEVKRRIILGTYVLSSGYYEAYYLRAQRVRTLVRQDFAEVFGKVEALVSPTSPTAAFKIGERTTDPLQMYLADIFTNAANLAGICGISIPCGFVPNKTGVPLPVGLQILGPAFGEPLILRIAHAFEQSTDWHRRRSTEALLPKGGFTRRAGSSEMSE